jgi:hypothetical protein
MRLADLKRLHSELIKLHAPEGMLHRQMRAATRLEDMLRHEALMSGAMPGEFRVQYTFGRHGVWPRLL